MTDVKIKRIYAETIKKILSYETFTMSVGNVNEPCLGTVSDKACCVLCLLEVDSWGCFPVVSAWFCELTIEIRYMQSWWKGRTVGFPRVLHNYHPRFCLENNT